MPPQYEDMKKLSAAAGYKDNDIALYMSLAKKHPHIDSIEKERFIHYNEEIAKLKEQVEYSD
jgi:hypothetical protein